MPSPTAPWSSEDPAWVSSTIVAAGTSDTKGVDRYSGLILRVSVAAASGVGTLSLFLQTKLPGLPEAWMDLAAFTAIAGNTTLVLSFLTTGNAFVTPTDGTLAAGTLVTAPLGKLIRMKWTATGTPTFPLTVAVLLLE